jgi:hypothetical protein
MKNIIVAVLLVSSIIFYSPGCADRIVTENDLKPVTPSNIQLSKFSELQKNIFTPTCALAGCHLGADAQANLDLSEGKSYSNLINIQSLLFPSYKRVVPGNKEQSLLYLAINYSFPQLQMPLTGNKLDQYLIDSLSVWIDKGALND